MADRDSGELPSEPRSHQTMREQATPTHPPAHGLVAERYEILGRLGAGGMGHVERVRDRMGGGIWALKWAPLDDAERVQALRHEFEILSWIAHEQVPAVSDLGQDRERGWMYIVLELAEGEGLGSALTREGPWGPTCLLAHALNVVGFLHARGVVHGDLKPDHFVWVQGDGTPDRLLLLDYGLAVRAGETQGAAPRGGTHAYLDPVVRDGGALRPAADLYALGVTFQELLADHPRAESLHPLLARLAHPDPDLRPGTAWEVLPPLLEALGERPPMGRPTQPPFVGRRSIMDALLGELAAVRAGHLRHNLRVLEGPAGSGRTRMLDEVRAHALMQGIHLLAHTLQRLAPPLELAFRLGEQFLVPGSDARRRLDATRAQLGGLASSSNWRNADRVLHTVTRLLREAARKTPMIILLDGLEAADEHTLRFLRFLHRTRSPHGPWVLAACDTDAPVAPELKDLLQDLAPEQRTVLEPLAEAEVRRLLASLASVGGPSPDELSERAPLAQGRPRLAVRLARDDDSGDPDRWFTRLWERLSEVQRDVVSLLAALGRAVPPRLLREVPDRRGAAVGRALAQLTASGLVVRDDWDGRTTCRLAASDVVAGVRARHTDEAWAALHGRLFDALWVWSDERDRAPERLALHAVEAGRAAVALGLGMPAAERMLHQGGLRGAEHMLRRLEALAPPLPHETALDLQEMLLEVEHRRGHAEAARTRAQRLLEALAPESSAGRCCRVLTTLASACEALGDIDAARAHYVAAHELDADAVPLTDRLRLAEREGSLHYRLAEHLRAAEVWQQGLHRAGELTNDVVVADLWNNLGIVSQVRGDMEEAASRHQRALTLRRGLGDLDGEARSLGNLANLAFVSGHFRRAQERYGQALQRMQQVGSLQMVATVHRNVGLLSSYVGDYAEALEHLTAARALRERLGDGDGCATADLDLAQWHADKGQWNTVQRLRRAYLDYAASGNAGTTAVLLVAVRDTPLLAEMGDIAGAQESLAQAETLLAERDGAERWTPDLMLARAQVAWAAGRLGEASSAAQACRQDAIERADRWMQLHAARLQGMAALAVEDLPRADARLTEALDLASALEADPYVADALVRRVAVHHARADLDAAHRDMNRAQEGIERFRLPTLRRLLWVRQGVHALHVGRLQRALACWRAAARGLLDEAASLGDVAAQERFLRHPDRREPADMLALAVAGLEQAEPVVRTRSSR